MKSFTLSYTLEAKKRIRHLHPSQKQEMRDCLDELKENPWVGKALTKELSGLYSLRVKSYRIIYTVADEKEKITILTLGRRKTIYEELIKK